MNLHTNLDLTILSWVWGAVLGISAVSATFFCSFPDFELGLGCCLGNLCRFSYFFLLFSGFWAGFGVLFGEFLRFQLHKTNLLCYQPMAIVHYANLVLLNKYTFLTEVGTRAPGTDGAPVLSCRHIAKQFRYC